MGASRSRIVEQKRTAKDGSLLPRTTGTKALAVGLQELQRNSNCKELRRNEKNPIPAKTIDVLKTKSRGINT